MIEKDKYNLDEGKKKIESNSKCSVIKIEISQDVMAFRQCSHGQGDDADDYSTYLSILTLGKLFSLSTEDYRFRVDKEE